MREKTTSGAYLEVPYLDSFETFEEVASLLEKFGGIAVTRMVDQKEVLLPEVPPGFNHLREAQEFAELSGEFEPNQVVRIFHALGAAQENNALKGVEIFDLTPGKEHLRDYHSMEGIRQLVSQSTIHLHKEDKIPRIGNSGIRFLEKYSADHQGRKKQTEET